MLGHGYLNALMNAKSTVYGPLREKVGTLGNIYMDVGSGDPDFVTVRLGLFGSEELLVSLRGAVFTDGHLQVRFSKDVIRHSPSVDPGIKLGDAEKALLDGYYSAMDPDTGE
ncbi:PRC-barrel domain-containing protein [Paeniglutamicibacter sp. MACA_103]|uniref:PRC-barrel domain-containing protein n=1 Tax=Paeniglutamicibacter sp. MACA_103 TaxID=3377337 RepID=UPI003893274D